MTRSVKTYQANRANYLKATYNETQLRADFLGPLFELLGWDIKNISGNPTNEREVLLEEALRANASENSKKPDYTFRLFSERKFFLEAKKSSVSIDSNIDNAKQVRRYGFTAKLKISVLSNFEYLLIYDCSVKVEKDDSHNKALVKKYHYTEYADKFHQSLDKCGLPEKIIVGVLSVGDKYAIDFHGTLISSGGTAGYCVVALPPDSPYSIYYIQALLNSKYMEWYSALLGEVFRGGYIARGTKVLKRLPVRKIDFTNKDDKAIHNKIVKVQKKLILKQGEIDQNQNNKRTLTRLNREFESLKKDINELLKTLFDLGNDDSLIPLIKEMYEAN